MLHWEQRGGYFLLGSLLPALFFGLALFGGWAAFMGMLFHPRWHWYSALALYIASFLSGFSIGLLLLVTVFAELLLAIGHQCKWLKTRWHSAAAVLTGVALWYLTVRYIDDAWIFLPFRLLP